MSDNIKINVPAAFINAAMCAVSKEETRYYLKGVFIDGRGYIAATNGHIAFGAKCAEATAFHSTFPEYCGMDCIPGVIVPYSAVVQAAKGKGDNYTIERDVNGLYWLSRGNVRVHFVPVDGNFPDCTRVVPEQAETETAAHYRPQYVTAISKMAIALRDGKKGAANAFHICQAGEGPALVLFPRKMEKLTDEQGARTDVCAVIMPMRASNVSGWNTESFKPAY